MSLREWTTRKRDGTTREWLAGTVVKVLAELAVSALLGGVLTLIVVTFLPTRALVAVVPAEASELTMLVTFLSLTTLILNQWVACDFDA